MKNLLAVSALAAMASLTSAATVSYNVSIPSTNIGDPTFNLSLPKFDPTLGFLTKVTIKLDADTVGNAMSFDNEAGSPGNVTLNIGATVTANSPSITAVVATPTQNGTNTVTADEAGDGAGDQSGPDSFAISGGSGSDTDSQFSTSAPVLALYTASFVGETFSTSIDNSIFTSTSTSGIYGPTATTAGTFDGLVTVTYDYTIPEPSSMALIGLVGAGALLRRRI